MVFDVSDSVVGLLCLIVLILTFLASVSTSPLAAVSLPCLTTATTLVYFFYLPLVILANGDEGYFGMYISGMAWTHLAVMLYALGAAVAFYSNRNVLSYNPGLPQPWDEYQNNSVILGLWGIAILGVIAQFATGKLNLTGSAEYDFAADKIGELAFLTQAYNLLVPLTIAYMLKDNFRRYSWIVLAIVIIVFLQAGFRFRIMLMLAGLGTAFAMVHGFKIRTPFAMLGLLGALVLSNLIGAVRRYGQGVDLSGLTDAKLEGLTTTGGGEFGVVYVLDYTANNPLPDLSPFEPWAVAIARLIPSFIWRDKPTAEYVKHFIAGSTVEGAEKAGIAATQHVEMLLQWGWLGIFPLAFMYFSIACLLMAAFLRCGREARITGCALIPGFFGYYMQTRGYFFQIFADGLFMLGPIFLFDIGRQVKMPRVAKMAAALKFR